MGQTQGSSRQTTANPLALLGWLAAESLSLLGLACTLRPKTDVKAGDERLN